MSFMPELDNLSLDELIVRFQGPAAMAVRPGMKTRSRFTE